MRTKNSIFERDFQIALGKALEKRKEGSEETYAEKVNWQDYKSKKAYEYKPPFSIPNDDKYQSLMWSSLLKDTAHYYDTPEVGEEREMRFKLQKRYDSILKKGWRPPLQSRRDLVTWACEQRN